MTTCSPFQYTLLPDGSAEITRYLAPAEQPPCQVTVPAELDGHRVTAIGRRAFSGYDTLTDVTLPEGVATICAQAFYNCRFLKRINLPDALTSIGDEAFCRCSNLTDLALPQGLRAIRKGAFSFSGLERIAIPEGITEIQAYAFSFALSLKEVILPGSLTSIGDSAFLLCWHMSAPVLPDGLISIGEEAFRNCERMTCITLPDSVIEIGNGAFSSCDSLTHFVVSPGNPALTVVRGALFDKVRRELICCPIASPEESFRIPAGARGIRPFAFSGCKNLQNIAIPDSLTAIGASAFLDCQALVDFSISPDHPNLKFVGGMLIDRVKREVICYPIGQKGRHCHVPEGTRTIRDHAFAECKTLRSVSLPESLTNIADGAFANCRRLSDVTLPEGLTFLGLEAFEDCRSLKTIRLPDSLTSVASNPFVFCDGLSDIIVSPRHPTLEVVDGLLMNKVTKTLVCCLTADPRQHLTLPQGTRSIGRLAFNACKHVTHLTLPDSVTSIGELAFSYNDALTSVAIPASVTDIAEDAFVGSKQLSVTAPRFSFAERWCRRHNVPCSPPGSGR